MNPLRRVMFQTALALATALGGMAPVEVFAGEPAFAAVDVQQGRTLKEQGALLLDVREPGEYEQGHAPGSTLIPLGQLSSRLHEIRAYVSRPVAVICRSGRRSAQAAEILSRAGFTSVYNVQGGMNAWEAAALPIIKGGK